MRACLWSVSLPTLGQLVGPSCCSPRVAFGRLYSYSYSYSEATAQVWGSCSDITLVEGTHGQDGDHGSRQAEELRVVEQSA